MSVIILQGEDERRRGIHYEMDSTAQPIGEGGMGRVYQGISVDERTGATRPVAIKFLYEDLPAQAYERARREASIQLRNDNLIEMLGFLETRQQGSLGQVKTNYHVVSELLDGVSLSDLMEQGRVTDRDGQPLPYAQKLLQDYRNNPEQFARTVVMNVLSGLIALHDAGYVHRDIDPSNIMITSSGHIKLIDFGIAKQMNTLTTGDRHLTVAGKFMGKPEYAAPELAMGDVEHQNQTTDIYAMGILLYQCITGHTPFDGVRHEVLEMQIKGKLPLNDIRHKELRRIIAKACEKKQDNRYQSATQMRAALEMVNTAGGKSTGGGSGVNWPLVAGVTGGAVALIAIVTVVAVVFILNSSADEEVPASAPVEVVQTSAEENQPDEVQQPAYSDLASRLRLNAGGLLGLNLGMEASQVKQAMSVLEGFEANPGEYKAKVAIDDLKVVVSAFFDDADIASTSLPLQLSAAIPHEGDMAGCSDRVTAELIAHVKSLGETLDETGNAVIVKVSDDASYFIANDKRTGYIQIVYGSFSKDDIDLTDFK